MPLAIRMPPTSTFIFGPQNSSPAQVSPALAITSESPKAIADAATPASRLGGASVDSQHTSWSTAMGRSGGPLITKEHAACSASSKASSAPKPPLERCWMVANSSR